MKKNRFIKNIVLLLLVVSVAVSSCTDGFEEINTDPTAFSEESISPVFFLPKILTGTFSQGRYSFWRGSLIHGERYADFVRFGHQSSWWNDGLAYNYHDGYTNAFWSEYYVKVPANIKEYLSLVSEGGVHENPKLEAVGLISQALFFQLMTDTFGDIPFKEAGNVEFLTPVYDTQQAIYKQLIADLGQAIVQIGESTSSGDGVQNLSQGDLLYDGDLQKWKKLANSLRLRMAMRAHGSSGADFATQAITASLSEDLMSTNEDAALIKRDLGVSKWEVTSFESVWWDFSWGNSARWTLSQTVMDMLRKTDDPRMKVYARPAQGGVLSFSKSTEDFDEMYGMLKQILDDAGVVYVESTEVKDEVENMVLTIEENKYYLGQPARFNGRMQTLLKFELFSTPTELIVGESTRTKQVKPTLVFSTAEAYFLQAEAVLKGLGAGNSDELYKEGIKASLEQWGVDAAEMSTFLASPAVLLTGSMEEKLGQVATQRWLANFGNGFEAWAVMRDTGYPMAATADIPDDQYHDDGTVGKGIPQRMRYPSSEETLNPENFADAKSKLSDGNTQKSKLWWAL